MSLRIFKYKTGIAASISNQIFTLEGLSLRDGVSHLFCFISQEFLAYMKTELPFQTPEYIHKSFFLPAYLTMTAYWI